MYLRMYLLGTCLFSWHLMQVTSAKNSFSCPAFIGRKSLIDSCFVTGYDWAKLSLVSALRYFKSNCLITGVEGTDMGCWSDFTLVLFILFRMQSLSSCSSYQLLSWASSWFISYDSYGFYWVCVKWVYFGSSLITLMKSLMSMRTLSFRQTQLLAL